jgi:hypothetical protein
VLHLLWHRASVFLVSSEGSLHSVAFHDTLGNVDDLFYPVSSQKEREIVFRGGVVGSGGVVTDTFLYYL